jgi:DNA-binding CsgD family transcriptional regulator
VTFTVDPDAPTEADWVASLPMFLPPWVTSLPMFPPPVPPQTRAVVVSPMLANVLESLCEGKDNRGIGRDWGITEDTVKTHMRRLLRALDAQDRTQAVILVLTGQVQVRIKPAPRGISQHEARWEQINRAAMAREAVPAGSQP